MVNYWNWCHGLGIHMYFIPSLVVLAILLIGAGVHWRNQRKREKEGEKAEEQGAAAGAASLNNQA